MLASVTPPDVVPEITAVVSVIDPAETSPMATAAYVFVKINADNTNNKKEPRKVACFGKDERADRFFCNFTSVWKPF